MAGVKGQGRRNGNALKHGGRSLLALVERSQDESHPVMQIIGAKARGYVQERGGPEALSLMEQDTLRHGAVLALLADMHLCRIVNDQGRPRRMNAMRFRDLSLAYARLAEAHNRILSSVGLGRAAKLIDDPVEAARALAREQDAGFKAYRERARKNGEGEAGEDTDDAQAS